MGREIRRVVPNWEHPRRPCEHSPWKGGCDEAKENDGQCYQPLHDEDYESAASEWKKEFYEWENGGRQAHLAEYGEDYEYWVYNNPPDKEYYRPKWAEGEATWYQVYQTVSEGSPVTPPFATKEELVDYLVNYGDFWDQQRGDGGWSRENAEKFVGHGFAMSMIAVSTPTGTEIKMPRDGQF